MSEVWMDIGNSRAKLLHYDSPVTLTSFEHDDTLLSNIDTYLAHTTQTKRITRIALANSAGKQLERKLLALCKPYTKNVYLCVSTQRAQGVKNGYNNPETLGVDRWLSLLGARSLTQTAAMVIDLGTAITCDFLAPDGKHLGGWIVPSIHSLHTTLARLPTLKRHTHTTETTQAHPPIQQYGRSTEEALHGGVQYMVLHFLTQEWHRFCQQATQNGWQTQCYTTGGSELVYDFVRNANRAQYLPMLVFIGMAQLLNQDSTPLIKNDT